MQCWRLGKARYTSDGIDSWAGGTRGATAGSNYWWTEVGSCGYLWLCLPHDVSPGVTREASVQVWRDASGMPSCTAATQQSGWHRCAQESTSLELDLNISSWPLHILCISEITESHIYGSLHAKNMITYHLSNYYYWLQLCGGCVSNFITLSNESQRKIKIECFITLDKTIQWQNTSERWTLLWK